MSGTHFRTVAVIALTAVCFAADVSTAHAWGHRRWGGSSGGSWGGIWGSYGSFGSGGSAGSWGSYGSWGGAYGPGRHWRRRALGSWGGSWGSYGSSGGDVYVSVAPRYWDGYGRSGGSWGGSSGGSSAYWGANYAPRRNDAVWSTDDDYADDGRVVDLRPRPDRGMQRPPAPRARATVDDDQMVDRVPWAGRPEAGPAAGETQRAGPDLPAYEDQRPAAEPPSRSKPERPAPRDAYFETGPRTLLTSAQARSVDRGPPDEEVSDEPAASQRAGPLLIEARPTFDSGAVSDPIGDLVAADE